MALLEVSTWDGKLFSDGWQQGGAGTSPVIEPATGHELARFGLADAGDVEAAVARAKEAQREWAAASFETRAAVLRRAGDLFEEQAPAIHHWVLRETGGIQGFAGLQTHVAAQESFEAASLASQPYGEMIHSAQPRMSISRRLPAGVVGVISPFNAPLILSIRSVAPALALGNAVVLKPDPRTAVVGGFSIARVFQEAGLPDGLLHVLPGGADIGEAMVVHPDVRIISFTGSTAAGRRVGELAAKHLKRAHLELGGNSALIVLDDVDMERAVSAGAFGSFMHQGQICMTSGRHLVHEKIYDEYVDRLTTTASNLPVGDPTSGEVALGPIIDDKQRDRIHRLVTDSVDQGATLAAGGTYDGLFYRPTVITDVSDDTPAYRDEVFGPVAPVRRFSTLEEAAALASATDYGLSLGILSRDVMKAADLAARIPSGIVHINDQTVSDEAVIPFGGVGWSGTGARLGGRANLDAFTETQWLTMQREISPYPF
jgi:benzaldehyde dehydrogenase (NAD)